jgi:hypothetical protein
MAIARMSYSPPVEADLGTSIVQDNSQVEFVLSEEHIEDVGS